VGQFLLSLRNQLVQISFALCGLLLIASACLGQCNCPDTNTCAPCSGGITYLKLRYLGNLPYVLVSVSDNTEILHWSIENPGDEISFTGSLVGGAFSGNRARLFLNGFLHATIDTRCNAGIFVGKTFGDFVVVEAASRNNGPICCNEEGPESEAPTFIGCPDNVDATVAGRCSQTVSWAPPIAIDNCDLVSVTSTHNPGMSFPVGATLVTYSAMDGNGNSSQCSFTVLVRENTFPVIEDCPPDIVVSGNANCQATVSWVPPIVSDNCQGVTLTSTHTSGSTFEAGMTTVTYTATDASGNVTTCSFNVEVRDQDPELIFSNCPDSFEVNAAEDGSTLVTWKEPPFHGACSGLTLSQSHTPGSLFDVGDTNVTYPAANSEGVLSSCSFTVSVIRHGIVVHEVVTPNGDGVNEIWIIQNIENYSDNSVMIYDRWGSVVYSANGYDNDTVSWDGNGLPGGTYFFRITTRNAQKVINKTGFIELVK
jgi:gliding motility-associated-like protein